ncbi:hypothetical protein PSEUBRA_003225 [Kalmanozyma brasiliensis GHG001]|uniref:uncharacterized protein n=1 Tax=Kalmanozyma brasiliensis (strain GHG001) TaxID=1365824 RepID=UPI001CEAB86C|nr:uncharacterized protein PSEUBRA_003225 [Kalmanozyma brasiliensis GHG001]EST07401.2 hypothetical protein PSEUBRA_003225 [Kalmanozyma brasiliensis GHG001]
MSTHLLPDLCLYGLQQIRSFAVSLDQDRLGIRALARSRVQRLTLRARSRQSLQHGYGPALFDASQAQTHFEKDLLPFVRVLLSNCHALQELHLEGVPRGLHHHFSRLAPHLTTYDCLMGHYGADIERDFWLPSRWTQLRHLQLHGPRFRFTPSVATALACLPQLTRLGLVVPMIVSSPSSPLKESGGVELDMAGSINPIQILIDRCPSLEMLLLVGHAESDYVGFTEKYRRWLRRLRRPRLNDTKVRLELVTVLRREAHDESYGASRTRVHPCEVSAWTMGRARHGLQWFDGAQQEVKDEKLDYWTESFELADHPSNPSTVATTSATSALMSRTGSNSPLSAGDANGRIQQRARQHQLRTQVDDAIEAVDMLSDDEVSSDEP